MSRFTGRLVTVAVLLLAAVAFGWKYWQYLHNPWTRNAQVRAKIVEVAPRVSAPIITLPIRDNQRISKGDLLFAIDPRTFRAALDEMHARYDETLDNLAALQQQVEAAQASVQQARQGIALAQSTVDSAQAQLDDAQVTYDRFKQLVEDGAVSVQSFDSMKADWRVALANKRSADSNLLKANDSLLQAQAALAQSQATRGAEGAHNAQLRAARADIQQAELDLEFTSVRASVDGYVTNLRLRLGTQAVANQPVLALVDATSFWIDAYFRETVVSRISQGDMAVVTLMGYADTPLTGRVESIGWGIAQEDGGTGDDLLPTVKPTFEWIRLAQRIPVRIVLEAVPESIPLRIGTTASVLVITGSAEQLPAEKGPADIPAAPFPLL